MNKNLMNESYHTEELQLVKLSNTEYGLSGILDKSTVSAFWPHRQETLPEDIDMIIDLSNIAHSDSAGIALLACLQKQALQSNHQITFINPPYQLQQLIKLSHLENVLNRKQAL